MSIGAFIGASEVVEIVAEHPEPRAHRFRGRARLERCRRSHDRRGRWDSVTKERANMSEVATEADGLDVPRHPYRIFACGRRRML